MQRPRCSVIIVGYNHASDLPACLEGVLSQTYPHVEIILVDNASQDATPGVAVQHRKHVRYLRLAQNSGFAAGNNAGAAMAQGELLVFLNPDAVPRPGWLETLVQPLLDDETIGLTTSRILLHTTPHLVNTCGNDVTWTGITVCRGLQQPAARWVESGEVVAASGAACAVRRLLFEQLGGFDETFFLYYEDTDLSLRARLAGYRIWYAAGSLVTHRYTFRFSPQKTYYQERNRWLALLKVLQGPTLLLLLPGLLLGELIAWVYAGLQGWAHVNAKGRSWLWLWQNRAHVAAQRRATQALRRVPDKQLLAHWSPYLRFTGTVPERSARLLESLVIPLLRGYGSLCRRLAT